jgi:DNA-binding transcriptional MerR regulator
VSVVPSALAAKSPEAFRTISEAAVELDVAQHVLRFWETRFAQIRPVKRAGGRRYYRPEDVELLRGIRALLYTDGYTIKGVQRILREQGARHVAEIGRQAPRMRARRDPPAETVDEPRYARAAIARVQEAHADLLSTGGEIPKREPDKATRAKLEALLKELMLLKGQLRFAGESLRG